MDGVDSSWLWTTGLIAFSFGVVAGAIVAAMVLGGGRRGELKKEVDRLQRELDDYREQVTAHFRRTSELVDGMTRSYRDLYAHLASSSQQLCDQAMDTPRLDIDTGGRLTADADTDADSGSQEAAGNTEIAPDTPPPRPATAETGPRPAT